MTHQLWKPKHVLLCFAMVSPYGSHFRPEHVKQNQPNTSKYHSQNTILQHILGYVPIISPFITKQINMSNFQKLIELSLSKSHLIVIVQCFPCFSHYPGFSSGFPMISIISMFFHVLVYVAFQGFPSNFWWVFPSSASWCPMLFLWIFHGFPCFSYGFSLVFPVFFIVSTPMNLLQVTPGDFAAADQMGLDLPKERLRPTSGGHPVG